MARKYTARWVPQGDDVDAVWVYEVTEVLSGSTNWINLYSRRCTCTIFQQMEEPCRHVFAIYGTRPFLPRPPFAESYHDLVGPYYLTSTHIAMYTSVPIVPDLRNLVVDANMVAPPPKRNSIRLFTNPSKRRRVSRSFLLQEDTESLFDRGVGGATTVMGGHHNLQQLMETERAAVASLCRLSFLREGGHVARRNQIRDMSPPSRPVGAPTIRRYSNTGLNC